MKIINRNSFMVKPKQPYVDWINAHPDTDTDISLEETHQECTIFLIPEMIGEDDAREYIEAFKLEIFEMKLDLWYRDPSIWPQKRTPAMFDEWFDLEFHAMILDLDRKRIAKERYY
jgi:hypothetical protein